jgi:putative endonuclease
VVNHPSFTTTEIGRRGEDFAADILARHGYRVVARNVHSRYGEIDLIAVNDEVICFVEVKTRRRGNAASGTDAVGRSKQRKIIMTALYYMQRHPEYDLQPRFDILQAETDGKGNVSGYDYIMGAFDSEAYR